MRYGLTFENEKIILEKAKPKKNGCYKFRAVAYRVVGGNVTHFASKGEVIQRTFGFNVIVGSCELLTDYALKALKSI